MLKNKMYLVRFTDNCVDASQFCPIWGQSDPILMPNLTSLLLSYLQSGRRGFRLIIIGQLPGYFVVNLMTVHFVHRYFSHGNGKNCLSYYLSLS